MTFYLQILTCYNSNYWIFNCEYCISNVLIGSLNSGYQLMFQVTLYGIIELMQRPKKILLFILHTSCIFSRVSFPSLSMLATWISIWANWPADLASCTCCTCYKMIILCLLLEPFTMCRVKCKERKWIFVTLLTEGQRGQDSGTPFKFDTCATNLRGTS